MILGWRRDVVTDRPQRRIEKQRSPKKPRMSSRLSFQSVLAIREQIMERAGRFRAAKAAIFTAVNCAASPKSASF